MDIGKKRAKYKLVFSTPEGKLVLEDLKKKFQKHKNIDNGVDGVSMALSAFRFMGNAEVINHIENIIKQGESDNGLSN